MYKLPREAEFVDRMPAPPGPAALAPASCSGASSSSGSQTKRGQASAVLTCRPAVATHLREDGDDIRTVHGARS